MAAPTPQSVAVMDPVCEKRLRQLAEAAGLTAVALGTGNRPQWFRPGGWNGDLHALNALAEVFDRAVANQVGVDAVKDAQNPGTPGDVALSSMMIELLSELERGGRSRFLRRPQAAAAAMARLQGHAHAGGPILGDILETLREVLRRAKESPT